MYPYHGFWFGAFQIGSLVFWLLWLGLALWALFSLRDRSLDDLAKVVWVLLILLVPILGAVAFWIVNPGRDRALG